MICIKGRTKIMLLVAFCISVAMVIIIAATFAPKPPPELPPIPGFPGAVAAVGDADVTLSIGWNLASMPEYVNKHDVYFTYNNASYNWTEASDNLIIGSTLYAFNGTDYISSDVFLKTKGYWLYSFVEPVYMSSEPLVIFCSKIYYDGTEDMACTRLVISPIYDLEIHCKSMAYQEVNLFYYDPGVMP